ncbi:unnamed protein product [Owenia fusiformis]|uniref:Rap guanine nucleotide exchange factor 4 n=1 Tax=Owenia fusiformis TaxID=6347 RepID=A0A8S4P1S2_OWEFU|nr:unnamed protein product [Owenia fusiformis]
MMVPDWILCLDKRPCDRSADDLDIIYTRLKNSSAFEKYHPILLQQICFYCYYEDLEKGVTLFRQGDMGTNWYTVLSGALVVHISETGNSKDAITLCTLGSGSAFGESILNDTPRHATVVTSDYCELLRVEQKDFRTLWERNKNLVDGVLTPIPGLPNKDVKSLCGNNLNKGKNLVKKTDGGPNPAAPITNTPSEKLVRASNILRTVLLARAPHMIRDRKYHLRTYRRCMVGTEMIDWLLQQSSQVHSRNQAVGMWQSLLEEGLIVHVCHEHQMKDKYLFYRFLVDDEGVGTSPSHVQKKESEDELQDTFSLLAQIGPDAMMRMILRKIPEERSVEDLEIIYEELLHIKALSHLSTMVKRELASVLVFESHAKSGTTLFNQGDEGKSWYIILKGSVNVVIYGKGVVCTLHEGDDFGKLALVNDAPRAATIVLNEDNCHFLRVDKDDFNRILRDVEANTVRLKEHGQDVLVLEKIPINKGGNVTTHYKYSVMAGTPDKMLEHLLETRIDQRSEDLTDTFMEDFLLTHVIFMPTNHLCPTLMAHYHAEAGTTQDSEQDSGYYGLINKRRVIHFVENWVGVICDAFYEDSTIVAFLEELHSAVTADSASYPALAGDLDSLERIMQEKNSINDTDAISYHHRRNPKILIRKTSRDIPEPSNNFRKCLKAGDENLFKVYCADHTYTTLKLPMIASVDDIISHAAEKLCLGNDVVLCEVKSTGERVLFKEEDICITLGLSINGKLFLSSKQHIDALTPLPEQDGPSEGSSGTFELLSSRDIAYQMMVYDWQLFTCMHEYELIYKVMGRSKFNRITANLDIFLRRFNEIQYWVVSEMCLASNLGKRVTLLRKFIKLAAYCKEYQNLNSFFAIVMGLSNIAVSRLSQTWEKLPSKFKKMFSDFETTMDPSRNHRVYRLAIAKMAPPMIPFMPLLMKDITFTHEGNKTYFDHLVNFEKMHMISQTIRIIRQCRSKPLSIDSPANSKSAQDAANYISSLKVIDNQRILNQLSHRLEPRRS